jgi:serine/threonine protein kinase
MITLGPYTLLRRIGSGGMGEVWIARRPALGGAAKLVAIKTVLPDKARHPESRRMFLDEARLSMLMTNSNIVQVFDVDETPEGICYMAMEYVEGIDLSRLCDHLTQANDPLSPRVIGYIIGEILKALAYAHDLNVDGTRRTIVHRDISPQNVMLSVSGEVKVMDFGIAQLSSEETSGLFVKGKIRYMPPEQFTRGLRKPTLDLFAVGAILHELLDGQRFRGGDYEQAELIGMCMRGDVPPLTCSLRRVPPMFEQLRRGLLEPVAAKRIQSAREAHRLLSRWPGDRDAKFELEEIVRRFVSDSSLTAAAVVSGESMDVAKSPTIAAPLSVALEAQPVPATATTSAVPSDKVELEVEPAVSCDELTDIRRIGDASDTNADIRRTASVPVVAGFPAKWLFGTLAGVGGLIALGLGTTRGVRMDDSSGPAVVASSAQPVIVKAKPPPPPLSEVAPTVEPEPTTAEEPAPEPEPKSKRTAKTSVTITASGVWAQVKIGPKRFTLDRLAGAKRLTTKIEPGEYTVSFRNDPDAAWEPLGKVRIPARGPVTLDIEAGKFTLEK